jgi:DinB superfamily
MPDPASDPEAYRAALIAQVGCRDPMEIIASTPSQVRQMTAALSDDQLARRPSSDEWSITEIIGHLLDDEIINSFRLRMTLTDPATTYPGTEPDRWAALPKPDAQTMLTTWAGLRAYHVALLGSLTTDQLLITGLHAEQGPESVQVQLLKNAGHDLAHLEQLQRTLNLVVNGR